MFMSFAFFGCLYLIFVLIGKKYLKKSSEIVNLEQNNIVKNLQNGLGAIRDIILDRTQDFYLNIFQKANIKLAKKQAIIDELLRDEQKKKRDAFDAVSDSTKMDVIGSSLGLDLVQLNQKDWYNDKDFVQI